MAILNEEGVFVLADEAREELARFEAELDQAHMMGEWQVPRKPEPDPGGVPFLWKWDLIHDKMVKACDALSLDMGGRRSLLFVNPANLPNGGSILSVRVGLQMMNTSEIALAHKHTMSAIRFIIQGSPHAFTVVNGEKLYMDDWDLILTPPGSWHHHENHADEKVIWLDAIDTPYVKAINALFYQPHPEGVQPLAEAGDSPTHRIGWVRPTWEPARQGGLPIAYKWRDTQRALDGLKDAPGSPYDGILLKYVHPVTGGPVMPTFSCGIQMLRPGEQTRAHRHTSGAVYHVLRGQGVTQAGAERFEWAQGDSFVIPNWCWHSHANVQAGEDALLFVVDDAPVYEAVNLYREEGASE